MLKNLRKRSGAKVPLILLSIFLFLLLFAPAASAATYGDINDDGKINVQDVVLVQKYVLGLGTLTDAQKAVADVNGDGAINVQDVTLIMQYALGLIDEFPHAALKVSKVTAVNPKQVEVEFNRMLNAEEKTKMTTANFHVGLQVAPLVDRLTGTGSAVAVKEDGKTALLTMGNGHHFVNGSTTNRVVVRQAVGLATDHLVANLAFTDTALPTLVSVTTDSPTTIVMTFSEPLDRNVLTPTNITLTTSGGITVPLNLGSAVYVDARRELRIEAFSSLSAGSYTLAITSGTNLKDYAGGVVVPTSMVFTHTPITTPPTVSVKSATVNSVTLEFSRAINSTTLVNNVSVLFRHTVEGSTLYEVNGTKVTNPSNDNRTFVIDFTSKTLPVGSTTLWMKYADGTVDANKIKDSWGNIIQPFSLSVTSTLDTTAPTASVAVVSGSNTVIEIQYSKPVSGALTPGNYILRKGTTVIPFSGPVVYDLATNTYRITATSPMEGAHTLTISNIRDTTPAQNPMGTQIYAFDVPDVISPTVSNVMANTPAPITNANIIYVYFSEPMGTSAVNPANYRLVSSSAPLVQYDMPVGTTITQTANTIKITLPNTLGTIASNLSSPALNRLFIGDVKDLAGNTVNPMGIRIINPEVPFSVNPTSVTLHSGSQISFTTSRHLSTVNFAGISKSGGAAATSVSFVNNLNGTATVTANFLAGTFTTYIGLQEIDIAANALTDLNGFKNAAISNVDITVDQAAPVLVGAVTLDKSGNGKIDAIEVTYSEDIYTSSVSDDDYVVSGYTIAGVSVSGDVVTISLVEKVNPDTGVTPQVTQVGSVQDNVPAPRNTLGPQAAITPVDEAKPVMISAVTKSATTIEITYSENVTNNNGAPTQYTSSVGGVVSSVSASGNKVTLTLAGGLLSGTPYPVATITYIEGAVAARTKDTATVPNDALSIDVLIGITSGF